MADNNTNQGKGWHGDSKGHAEAGQQSSGKFKSGDKRTQKAAQAGGEARGEQMREKSSDNDSKSEGSKANSQR